jgi:UDP-glucose 4-epimerase
VYAVVGLSPFIRNFNYTNNVLASANVINSCINHDVKKIVFTSSMDVYGSHVPPFVESMNPIPEDPYGIAKYAVELDLAAAKRLFGLSYSIVRPHNVFGVYQNIWDKYRNVIGIWIRQTLSGQPLTVYGDGSQVRSFSDIKFYMEPFEKLMICGDAEIFNLGVDTYMPIIEAAEKFRKIAAIHGHYPRIVHLQKRDEVDVAYCNHDKAKSSLGFNDDTNFEELAEKMLIWAKTQKPHKIKTMQLEVEKNIYSFWKEINK